MNILNSIKTMNHLIAEEGLFNVIKRAIPMYIYAKKIGCRIYRNGSCFLWGDKTRFDLLCEKEQANYWKKQVNWIYKDRFPERYNIMHRFLEDNLWSKLDKTSTVADLPCGMGEWAVETAKYAGRVEGYEYSEGMVATAKHNAKKLKITNVFFQQADAINMKFEKKYDYFMLLGLLTYIYDIRDAEKIVRNIASAINGGGGINYERFTSRRTLGTLIHI